MEQPLEALAQSILEWRRARDTARLPWHGPRAMQSARRLADAQADVVAEARAVVEAADAGELPAGPESVEQRTGLPNLPAA